MKMAAKKADKAVANTINKYDSGFVTDEDDITGILIGQLDAALDGEIAGLGWSSSILRHRSGKAAEEKRIGADMIIHVTLNTPSHTYSKGVLIQAKRIDRGERMTTKEHDDLLVQCGKMQSVTPASFVFDYARTSMRCGSASKIAGARDRALYDQCTWTSYRFFLELFRSPIGDANLTSALVQDLPVPTVLMLSAEGQMLET
jgi:hypothetical protein